MGKKQLLFASIIYILSLSNVLADVQYQDANCLFCPQRRKMITTSSFLSKSYSPWREEGRYNNLKNPSSARFSYSIPARTLRYSSFAAEIDAGIIRKEIFNKVDGKPPSFDIKETLKGEKFIPPNKVGVALYRERKETVTFRHQIQLQEKSSGKWRNKGPVTVKYTYVNTAYPEIKVEIRDR